MIHLAGQLVRLECMRVVTVAVRNYQ
jgi:hypothetical protein